MLGCTAWIHSFNLGQATTEFIDAFLNDWPPIGQGGYRPVLTIRFFKCVVVVINSTPHLCRWLISLPYGVYTNVKPSWNEENIFLYGKWYTPLWFLFPFFLLGLCRLDINTCTAHRGVVNMTFTTFQQCGEEGILINWTVHPSTKYWRIKCY